MIFALLRAPSSLLDFFIAAPTVVLGVTFAEVTVAMFAR